eukprot:Anaeramoba_ignava/a609032_8.p1 GENE.a609032_8~~a609032_8.p1  ORF type:complete len:221 (+),score=35.71 a609032_8:66-728(+)
MNKQIKNKPNYVQIKNQEKYMIKSIIKNKTNRYFVLRHATEGTLSVVVPKGKWRNSILNVGNYVRIFISPENCDYKQKEYFCLTNTDIMIVEPDVLVNVTTVHQSEWCLRKVVLSQKFPRSYNELTEATLLVGNILHLIFQKFLQFALISCDHSLLEKIVREVILENWESMLLSPTTQVNQLISEIFKSIPHFLDWRKSFFLLTVRRSCLNQIAWFASNA